MPDERARILADAALKLTDQVGALTAVVEKLGDRLKETEELAQTNERRVKANERRAHTLRVLLVFDMLLTIVVSLLYWREFDTSRQLDITVSQVLCPLYKASLGAYNPNTRAPGPDRDLYVQNFAVIRQGYGILGCVGPYVPPPTTPPASKPPG